MSPNNFAEQLGWVCIKRSIPLQASLGKAKSALARMQVLEEKLLYLEGRIIDYRQNI